MEATVHFRPSSSSYIQHKIKYLFQIKCFLFLLPAESRCSCPAASPAPAVVDLLLIINIIIIILGQNARACCCCFVKEEHLRRAASPAAETSHAISICPTPLR
ncbi:hypothetical protein JOB18_005840 [Solea senegalensis]|uniref:Uncharacterized protein n=1 Tax=Solea senegalensis TaxID=28829 RepID=A0AAV6QUQ4_SOLSE|nr:hypothetical protein JOB18_005840 [Solea senegalensis]